MVVPYYYRTLNYELKKAIKQRKLSPDELKKIYIKLKKENDEKEKNIKKIMIALFILFLLFYILTLCVYGFTLSSLLLFVFVYAFIYYTQIGMLKREFNRVVKKSYPELANEIKL